MPIYEYRCKKCGKSVEAIQKVDDPPLKKCETCSGPLEKLISRSSFQLRGGGWFDSGYSSGSGSGSSGSSGSSSKSSSDDKKSSGEGKKSSGDDKKSSKASDVKAASSGCASGNCGCH